MRVMGNILYNKEYWQGAIGRLQSKLWDGSAYGLLPTLCILSKIQYKSININYYEKVM